MKIIWKHLDLITNIAKAPKRNRAAVYSVLKSLVAKRNVEILSIIWRKLPDDQKPIFESTLNIEVTPKISS